MEIQTWKNIKKKPLKTPFCPYRRALAMYTKRRTLWVYHCSPRRSRDAQMETHDICRAQKMFRYEPNLIDMIF